jgi:hypothetical protein
MEELQSGLPTSGAPYTYLWVVALPQCPGCQVDADRYALQTTSNFQNLRTRWSCNIAPRLCIESVGILRDCGSIRYPRTSISLA